MRLFVRAACIGAIVCLATAGTARAQSADDVLLVENGRSPASLEIGDYYARARVIPHDHIVQIAAATADTVARPDYERTIEAPIAAWLAKYSLQDKILYIVLTKGVPLRVDGSGGQQGTVASVDSELTLLYRKLVGVSAPAAGHVPNPYFLADKPMSEARPFTRLTSDIYLVTRLDGFTVDDVKKLVDRGTAPSKTGRIVLDEKAGLLDAGGDQWLQEAATRLQSMGVGDRTVLEKTSALAATSDPVLGYYSWGSNDRANRLRRFGFSFAPGAIGGMYVSTDGRTFAEPPADWTPSGPDGGPTFAGSFQSLAGDLIRDGITGVSGHVSEPYLDATIRPQILFPAYVSGMNLAESYYLAMPYLSWQTVIIGDPLCAPFRSKALGPDDLYKPIDAEMDLPALFAERRLAVASVTGLKADALKLVLKADAHLSQGNESDLESLLVRAADADPRFLAVDLRLAAMYEQRRDYDKAIARYQLVIGGDPRNVTALNNLAYALAAYLHKPADALPIAERAYAISTMPVVADTLGWVHHLLGDDRAAATYIDRAAIAHDNGTILLHAAIVHAALGDKVRARGELDAARKIDAALANDPDAKALEDLLAKP